MKNITTSKLIHADKKPLLVQKRQPNNPCICGSGKKQKKCCGMEKEYYFKNNQTTK